MTVTTLHTLTGLVADVPENVLDSDLGQYLLVVPLGTKPLAANMFKHGTVEEFTEKNAPLVEKLNARLDSVNDSPDAVHEDDTSEALPSTAPEVTDDEPKA